MVGTEPVNLQLLYSSCSIHITELLRALEYSFQKIGLDMATCSKNVSDTTLVRIIKTDLKFFVNGSIVCINYGIKCQGNLNLTWIIFYSLPSLFTLVSMVLGSTTVSLKDKIHRLEKILFLSLLKLNWKKIKSLKTHTSSVLSSWQDWLESL